MPDANQAPVELITIDAGAIYDALITGAEAAVKEPLYPGDERRIFLEAMMPVLVAVYTSVNDAARQSMLRYARGEVLDALGERLGVTRLAGTSATCTLRFELAEARKVATAIPKWTKVTADSSVYFATDRDAVIAAGETSVDVPATCTAPGLLGNGYPPQALSVLVDLIAYVSKVSNIDETSGGDDGELYDDAGDDRFRERIRLAPERLSVAGPEEAYVYWAKTADAGIADVKAISETETFERKVAVEEGKAHIGGDLLLPEGLTVDGEEEGFAYEYEDSLLTITLEEPLKSKPEVTVRLRHKMDGRVRIVPLMDGGELPDEDVLARVAEAVNARDVRPMTDVVTVEAPTRVEYGVKLTYWTTPRLEAEVVEAVEGDGGAIDRFNADQCSKLGRDIIPDVLKTYIMQPEEGPGAIRVEIEEPAYAELEDGQVAHFNGTIEASHQLETEARWVE